MPQTAVCMKWGTRYPATYVNCLWSAIQRNTSRPTRLVCYTDDPSGIDAAVETYPLPPIALPERAAWTPWRKLSLWQDTLPGLAGDVLFLDLDLVITGSLDAFFSHAPEATFCVIENWTQKGAGIGNTSVFRFRVGAHTHLFQEMEKNPEAILKAHSNEQIYISRTLKHFSFWPTSWCVSFKHNLVPPWPLNFLITPSLPPSARIVCFTGKPDPDEARDGLWQVPWYKKFYKYARPAPWIGEHWR